MTSFVGVRARYARRSGFAVSGDRIALNGLARILRGDASADAAEVLLQPGSEAAPYEEFMSKLVVRHDSGRVSVTKKLDEVLITGSPQHLRLLAENIEALADDAEGDRHLHVEYYPDHFYLDQSSEPLVIELES
jgi:hypothetical protein